MTKVIINSTSISCRTLANAQSSKVELRMKTKVYSFKQWRSNVKLSLQPSKGREAPCTNWLRVSSGKRIRVRLQKVLEQRKENTERSQAIPPPEPLSSLLICREFFLIREYHSLSFTSFSYSLLTPFISFFYFFFCLYFPLPSFLSFSFSLFLKVQIKIPALIPEKQLCSPAWHCTTCGMAPCHH